jgi:tRNA pseudouridine38-40 synthase
MDRWLVRFGYDGSAYQGWARQPGRPTIEGALRAGLARPSSAGAVVPESLRVASRTDRGVSARANALTAESRLDGEALLRVLNGAAPEVWFTDAVRVEESFRVRRAVRRTYRYFESNRGRSLDRSRAAARLFHGEVDVRSFARQLTDRRPVLRPIEAVEIDVDPDGWTVEVRAPSFVWGMVRKIVAALREVDAGRLALPALSEALQGTRRLALPLAEPEPLTLWEVEYPNSWTTHWAGPSRRQAAAAARAYGSAGARVRLLRTLLEERAANSSHRSTPKP